MNRSSEKQLRIRQQPHRDLTIDEIEREWARRQLVRFTERTLCDYRAGWFHRIVAAEADRFLAEVAVRQSPRLIPHKEGLDGYTEYEVNFDNRMIAKFYELQLRLVPADDDSG